MRRPPYSRRVMRGIFLVWKKMRANIEHGYTPHWWSRQDQKDVARAVEWLGDFFDWMEWKDEEKEKAKEMIAEEGEGACANA